MIKIHDRPTAGPWIGLALSLLFAGVMLPVATFDLWTADAVDSAGHAVFSVRLPETGVLHDTLMRTSFEQRRVLVGRGETVDAADRRLIGAFEAGRRPPSLGLQLGLGLAYFMIAIFFTSYLRKFGYRGALLRTQALMLLALVVTATLARAFLLFTPFSAYYLPVGALSIAVAVHHDRQVAFAATVAVAVLTAALMPFDLALALVLLIQGFGAAMVLGSRTRNARSLVLAGALSGVLAALSYVAVCFLVHGRIPSGDLTSLRTSGLAAAFGGGLASGLLATLVAPLIERGLGHVTRSRLIELTDLNQPMLKRIAENAPGTWAHSLAMANMAELAATAIGADALLTRVGAYFHDLGKSSAPRYYIENLQPGEPSPHDTLAPDVSADAIFSHCTEGVRLGRQAGIPEPVLDFMHMHHGNGLLEYFWHKNQEQGNPKQLSEKDFRYPGIPPQTKETAILAICDAVEAASRTLKTPEVRDLSNLVQRIVFGKLRLGQLDQSGLTSLDLKQLCNSLVDTLKSSFHVRIEYPWQKEERAKAAAALAGSKPAEAPTPPAEVVPAVVLVGESEENTLTGMPPPIAPAPVRRSRGDLSQQILLDRLDSADAPRNPTGALPVISSPKK